MAFNEKSVFLWNDQTIGDAAKVTALLKAAGFEAVLLHAVSPQTWRTASRVALVGALKAAGIKVYASVAIYGTNPESDGRETASIVNQYDLAGAVLDVESGQYEAAADAPARIRTALTAYKANTTKPVAFCGWAFYLSSNGTQYHPLGVLTEAMKLADVGMPMAYWYNGSTPDAATRELEACWNQWRKYTNKPIVAAGRAYNDAGIVARPDAIAAYEAKARSLGAVGVTWWDMNNAYKYPDIWAALTALPKFATAKPEPEEPPMTNPYKSNALGYFTKSVTDPGWNNSAFTFIVADGLKLDGVSKPNPELKPLELKAAEKGLPFIIVVNHTMAYYTSQSYTGGTWPSDDQDYPMLALKTILANRNFDELWINFTDPNDHNGKPGDASWLMYTLQMILLKIKEWKAANPAKKFRVRVITNWDFMKNYCGGGPAWLHNHDTGVKQQITMPHDNSYPNAAEKPAWLGVKAGGPFWWYMDRLIMFDGSAQELAALLGTETPQEPPTDPQEPAPDFCTREEYEALYEAHTALQAQFTALEQKFAAHSHPHTHDFSGTTGGAQ